MKKLLITFFVCAFSLSAFSQVTLIKKNGRKVEGVVVFYKAGKVFVATNINQSGAIGTRVGDIKQILTPIVRSVANMRKAYNKGSFAPVAERGSKTVTDNRSLGWGKRAAFYFGMSLFREGKVSAAEKVFEAAIGCVNGSDPELDNQLLALGVAFCKAKSASKVERILKTMAKDLKFDAKPFFYNLQGDLLAKQDKKPQAVLAYYKSYMIGTSSGWERGYAKSQIAKIYTEDDDPRAAKIKLLEQP